MVVQKICSIPVALICAVYLTSGAGQPRSIRLAAQPAAQPVRPEGHHFPGRLLTATGLHSRGSSLFFGGKFGILFVIAFFFAYRHHLQQQGSGGPPGPLDGVLASIFGGTQPVCQNGVMECFSTRSLL